MPPLSKLNFWKRTSGVLKSSPSTVEPASSKVSSVSETATDIVDEPASSIKGDDTTREKTVSEDKPEDVVQPDSKKVDTEIPSEPVLDPTCNPPMAIDPILIPIPLEGAKDNVDQMQAVELVESHPTPDVVETPPNDVEDSATEQHAQEMFGRANSMLEDLKSQTPLSTLENVIYFFREALDLRPAPHPLQSDSRNDLAATLITRFSHTHRRQDIMEAFSLHVEVLKSLNLNGETSDPGETLPSDWNDTQASEMSQLAKACLAEFNQFASVEDLDTLVHLCEEVLRLRPHSHPQYLASLEHFAAALNMRFRRARNVNDLEMATSSLREVLQKSPEAARNRASVVNDLSMILMTRFGATGVLEDLRDAVSLIMPDVAATAASRSSVPVLRVVDRAT